MIKKLRDLVDENGGALFDPYSIEDCKAAIEKVISKDMICIGKNNRKKIKF
jgi:hypothetical protein